MAIPTLPTTPSTASPSSFSSDMDAFLAALPEWTSAVNTAGSAFGVSLIDTSTTSLAIGTGAKSLTVRVGLSFSPGMAIIIASTATPSNRMICTVTSYNSTTGALVVNADAVGGSGTYASWAISPTAVANFDAQTYTDLRLSGKITESIYSLTGLAIDPANGSIQTKTLGANAAFTESLADGNSVVLMLKALTYTVVWPTITWLWGSAPALSTTLYNVIVMWQVGGVVYAVNAGTA